MSKITAYTAATRFDSGDKLLKDGTNGTKIITAANAAVEFAGLVSSINHRNVYRGKSLGSTITDDQKTAISEGTFDDLFIGDYWTINSLRYRIADMDYWYNTGASMPRTHHLVIVPDSLGITAVMNSSSVTDGGYVGSEMYTTTSPSVYESLYEVFGDSIFAHEEYLTNAVTSGYPSGAAWYDSQVELMNEIMVFGCLISAASNTGTGIASHTVDKQQLSLFRLNPLMMNIRVGYWLRDVVSSKNFAIAYGSGSAGYDVASNSYEVRPVFGITG
ncbi:MAG: hypothetical protein LUD77_11370 [Clostridiales bacterium]|nr:hypothetical protein [Clostridiales bacterium]